MKKLSLLFAFIAVSLTSCSSDTPGPQGPQGPEGPQGPAGEGVVGQTFEFEGVSFTYFADDNLYAKIIKVPTEIEVLESDVILVYLREVIDGTEIWNMIPQNFFLDQGIIQYRFNHATKDGKTDVELLIDGNFDLSGLENSLTENLFFRFVVVPSNFALDTGVDVSNYGEVMQQLQ